MARPRNQPDRARTTRINIRSTPAFRDAFAALAKKAGFDDLGTYLESIAKKEARRLKLPPPPPR